VRLFDGRGGTEGLYIGQQGRKEGEKKGSHFISDVTVTSLQEIGIRYARSKE